MGRKEERLPRKALEVKIPSFFRCPISLGVMKSPVSLCTGVTYDRASIQQWLDSGNTTCPATRQPLPSTDLVPNLTLQRLIHLWASSAISSPTAIPHRYSGGDLLRELRSFAADPLPALRRLADFFSDDENDDFVKNNLVNAGGCAAVLVSILVKKKDDEKVGLETLEAAIRVLAIILTSDSIEKGNAKMAISALVSNLNGSVSALVAVLKKGSSLESRIDAARVLESVLGSPETAEAVVIAEKEVIAELIRLIGPSDDKGTMDQRAVKAGLGCLAGIGGVRRARVRMARLGVVPAVTRVLVAKAEVAQAAAERAMRVMQAAAGCAEGRAAICEAAEESVGAVLGRMMKAGREGAEAAVAVLWIVCHHFRDRRAVEAVTTANGGLTKILLMMQSDCSPTARQMTADLLKIFRVNSKSCLSEYDMKTAHIMPF